MLRVKDMQMDIRGYLSFVVGTTPVSVASIIAGMGITNHQGIYLSVEGGDLRWRADGSNPTGTDGHLLYETEDAEAYDPYHTFIDKMILIRDAGNTVDVTVRISVY